MQSGKRGVLVAGQSLRTVRRACESVSGNDPSTARQINSLARRSASGPRADLQIKCYFVVRQPEGDKLKSRKRGPDEGTCNGGNSLSS